MARRRAMDDQGQEQSAFSAEGTVDMPVDSGEITTTDDNGNEQSTNSISSEIIAGSISDGTSDQPISPSGKSDEPNGSTQVVKIADVSQAMSDQEAQSAQEAWKKSLLDIRRKFVEKVLPRYCNEFIWAALEMLTDPKYIRLFKLTEYLYTVTQREWPGILVAAVEGVKIYIRSDRVRIEDNNGAEEFDLRFLQAAKEASTKKQPFSGAKEKQTALRFLKALPERLEIIFGMKRNAEDLKQFVKTSNDAEPKLLNEFWMPVFNMFVNAAKAVTHADAVGEDEELSMLWAVFQQLAKAIPEGSWFGFPILKTSTKAQICYFHGQLHVLTGKYIDVEGVDRKEALSLDLSTDEGFAQVSDFLRALAAEIIMELPLSMEALQQKFRTVNPAEEVGALLENALAEAK